MFVLIVTGMNNVVRCLQPPKQIRLSMQKLIFFIALQCMTPLNGAVHLVTNTNDSGVGSLRQAIVDANADESTPRTINFSIGSGVQLISPASALPALTMPEIIIDGSTQPGWRAGNPVIIIDGLVSDLRFDGITIDGASDCTIKDLVISNGFVHGITIKNSAHNNAIYNCFLGTDFTGTSARANSIGIKVAAFNGHELTNTIIGGAALGNLISGNTYIGIFLSGNVSNTVIQSNKIGTDVTGQFVLPNHAGIAIGTMPIDMSLHCSETQIGGMNAQEGNLISGNTVGIIAGFETISDLTIEGNILGFNITGTFSLPNTKNILTLQTAGSTIDGLLIQNNVS